VPGLAYQHTRFEICNLHKLTVVDNNLQCGVQLLSTTDTAPGTVAPASAWDRAVRTMGAVQNDQPLSGGQTEGVEPVGQTKNAGSSETLERHWWIVLPV